jgi:hypothetical protein
LSTVNLPLFNLTPDPQRRPPSPSERGALNAKDFSPSQKEKGLGDEVNVFSNLQIFKLEKSCNNI